MSSEITIYHTLGTTRSKSFDGPRTFVCGPTLAKSDLTAMYRLSAHLGDFTADETHTIGVTSCCIRAVRITLNSNNLTEFDLFIII